MAKQKSLEDLRKELSSKEAELEEAKLKLEQVEHKMNRLRNKIKTESKKQRDARTYALCFKAGHLEYVFPVIKDSGRTEFVQFIDGLVLMQRMIFLLKMHGISEMHWLEQIIMI